VSGGARTRCAIATSHAGTPQARLPGMRSIEPSRWDDYAIAVLLGLIAVPRLVLAILNDRPLGVEGTLSMVCVALALWIVFGRRPR